MSVTVLVPWSSKGGICPCDLQGLYPLNLIHKVLLHRGGTCTRLELHPHAVLKGLKGVLPTNCPLVVLIAIRNPQVQRQHGLIEDALRLQSLEPAGCQDEYRHCARGARLCWWGCLSASRLFRTLPKDEDLCVVELHNKIPIGIEEALRVQQGLILWW